MVLIAHIRHKRLGLTGFKIQPEDPDQIILLIVAIKKSFSPIDEIWIALEDSILGQLLWLCQGRIVQDRQRHAQSADDPQPAGPP